MHSTNECCIFAALNGAHVAHSNIKYDCLLTILANEVFVEATAGDCPGVLELDVGVNVAGILDTVFAAGRLVDQPIIAGYVIT